jgi:hypothetical protein
VVETIEEAPRLPSAVSTGDPKSAAQLISGFHQIEDGAWRWTQRQFTVSLGTPPGGVQRGATLSLKLTVAPVIIQKLKTITLSASINGAELPPETYTHPGDYVYQRDVPPNLLSADSVRVNFQVDHVMVPGGADQRELGLVVLRAGLESK